MVTKGNITVVFGTNYSGKTTLLKKMYKKEKNAIIYLDQSVSIEKMSINLKVLNHVLLELGLDKQKKISSVPFDKRRLYVLAMTIASDYKTIILDEPFLRFDRNTVRRLCRAIRYVKNNFGKTFYIASLNPNYLYQIADNIMLLNMGAVVFEGTKKDFFDKKDEFEKMGYVVPEITKFINLVEKAKDIKLGNIDNNNDLMKAIYQNTKY